MKKIVAVAGMILFGLVLFGCGSDDTQQKVDFTEPGGESIPLYKDGGVEALKNWPPPADTKMGDSNTPRTVEVKGADNVLLPDGITTINNDTWSPQCPDLQAPAAWPHPDNKRDITIKNSCSFPVWIGLQSKTILPSFCSVDKSPCSEDGDCTTLITQTCTGGICSEDTKSCTKAADCAAVTQVCVKNAYGDGFEVASGESRVYKLPNVWISGTIWGRTNCSDCSLDEGKGTRCCETGDASGTLYNRHPDSGLTFGPEKPITKIELDFETSPDFYDVSQVDGYNLPVQLTPVKGTGDDQTRTTGYWLGCPGVTGDVNIVCPDAMSIKDTEKYPFSSDFPLGIALKDASGKTIACYQGCSYKTRGSCKLDQLPCRLDQDCAMLKVCSIDKNRCNTVSDCPDVPQSQTCVQTTNHCSIQDDIPCSTDADCKPVYAHQNCEAEIQSCIQPTGNPNLLPEAADYCCDGSAYCSTLSTDEECGTKKRCPVTAISAFYKALASSAYAYTMGEDDWSTFNAGWKNGVGPDYYIEFCPNPGK